MDIYGKDPFEDLEGEIVEESIWTKPPEGEPQVPLQNQQSQPQPQQQVPIITPQVVPQIPFPPYPYPYYQYPPATPPEPQLKGERAEREKPKDLKKKTETAAVKKASYMLNFKLGNEFYGVDVENIREVVRVVKITPVPNIHYHILGIMNLRGKIFPVISLRRFFGMEDVDIGKKSKILVVEDEEEAIHAGVLVDDVSEVSLYYVDELEPISSIKFSGSKYARGILRKDDNPIVVIDIREILRESLLTYF